MNFNRDKLLAVARRLLRNKQDAEDAVQDGLLRAHRNAGQFRGQSSCDTWLHRIVVNACLQKLRGRRTVPLDAEPCSVMEDALIRDERCGQVRAAIDRLPAISRDVLILHDIRELSHAEISKRLRILPGTVKTRLCRARRALQPLLEAHV